MQCENCHKIIPDDSLHCPYCHVYFTKFKMDRNYPNQIILQLGNQIAFDLTKYETEIITIGRRDIKSNPDIDLGPYDESLTVSRLHGQFEWIENQLYYKDNSLNGSALNHKKLAHQQKYLLHHADELNMGNIKTRILFYDQ
ncbi:MAG: FHA domain-containing protein [Spirochaetes bacterium]|nr:FHA domain-containing protein [Spirochaetota bacterium]